jgi:putative ABC transport system permease protein
MEAFLAGQGALVSERAWRLDGVQVGDTVPACPGREPLPVLGVYRDYGNPVSQWKLAEPLFRACWPGRSAESLGIYGPAGTDWEALTTALKRDFGLGERELIDQRTLRGAGMAVFDRTFTVTEALNALTLLVAAIGIFCAVSAIHHHRIRQQALLTSLGVTGGERAVLQLAQWGLLGLFCTVLVWPFGAALAGVLAGVVTPVAFGWSFALRPDWGHYPALVLLAFTCLLAATAWPVLRLVRAEPGVLLKEAGP